MEECNCSLETALSWAVCAKNSLSNVYGYSLHQLVFGKNATFPCVLYDKLPALEENCHSKLIKDNLNALYSARKNYIKAESNEKLRRALRMKTRTHTGMIFRSGQSIYYKRENFNTWEGPGRVIGVDGQTVLVKHGGQIIRVHSSMAKLENSEFTEDNNKNDITNKNDQDIINVHDGKVKSKETGPILQDNGRNIIDEEEVEKTISNNEETISNNVTIIPEGANLDSSNEVDIQRDIVSYSCENDNAGDQVRESKTLQKLPTLKSSVLAKSVGSSDWRQLRVISRGGKASGKYAKWLNVLDEDTQQTECVNWDDIEEWKDVQTDEVLILENSNTDEILASK